MQSYFQNAELMYKKIIWRPCLQALKSVAIQRSPHADFLPPVPYLRLPFSTHQSPTPVSRTQWALLPGRHPLGQGDDGWQGTVECLLLSNLLAPKRKVPPPSSPLLEHTLQDQLQIEG